MVTKGWRQVAAWCLYAVAALLSLSTAFVPILTLGIRGWGNVIWWSSIWLGFLLMVIRWGRSAWALAPMAAALLPLWPIYEFVSPNQPGVSWTFSVTDGWSTESYVAQGGYYLVCFALVLFALDVYRRRTRL